jgi:UDP-2,3-diacylglucosamine hydrolase
MAELPKTLGIIAGSRSLPRLFVDQARKMGADRLVAAAFTNETDPALESQVDEMEWMRVGQLDRMIKAFTSRGVTQCVMVGQIAPGNLFNLRPDLRAMKLLLRIKEKNAQTIFGGIADEMAKDGLELITGLPWLTPLMPEAGYRLGPKPNEEQLADIRYGYGIAKEVSRLEIGQTVVVKDGTVLAVEGFEGTDKCLKRGGELAGKHGGAVAVKVAREGHDMRFDIPSVGDRTIQVCADNGVAVMAVEPSRTLVLDEADVKKIAEKKGICLTVIGNE